MPNLDYSVMIVGAGPAGISTWLHLHKYAPALASNAVLIEKESLPRDKLCGGGLTRRGDRVLAQLGLHIDVPSILIRQVEFRYRERRVHLMRDQGILRIIHRYEFDYALARAARDRGLQLREGESLLDYRCLDDAVEVRTSLGFYRIGVLVGADGANSLVRSRLSRDRGAFVSRLIEVVQENIGTTETVQSDPAVFDFSCLDQSVQGYVWDFPCQRGGVAHVNHGIFDSRARVDRRPAPLKNVFAEALQERGATAERQLWESHPIRWFSRRGCYSALRVLLVGDAAGVDPFLGEGISFALQYGDVAAREIIQSFLVEDFSLRGYRNRVLNDHLGKALASRAQFARIFYSRWPPAILEAGFSLLALQSRKLAKLEHSGKRPYH